MSCSLSSEHRLTKDIAVFSSSSAREIVKHRSRTFKMSSNSCIDHELKHDIVLVYLNTAMQTRSLQECYELLCIESNLYLTETDTCGECLLFRTYVTLKDVLFTVNQQCENESDDEPNIINILDYAANFFNDTLLMMNDSVHLNIEYDIKDTSACSSCPLIEATNQIVKDIMGIIEGNMLYKLFVSSGGTPIEAAESGEYPLRSFLIIAHLYRILQLFKSVQKCRTDSYSNRFQLNHHDVILNFPEHLFRMQVVPERGGYVISKYQASRKIVQSTFIHSIFFDFLSDQSADTWRHRPSLGCPTEEDKNCNICFSKDLNFQEMAVQSGCRHIFCYECYETWKETWQECPICGTISTEYIKGKGYQQLINKLELTDLLLG